GAWGPEETPVALLVELPVPSRYPVTDPPLLWKEVYHGAGLAARWTFRAVHLPAAATGLGLVLVVVLLGVPVLVSANARLSLWGAVYQIVSEGVNPVLRVVVILLAGAWGLGVAWRAAGSVSRERAKGTLVG